MIRYSDFNYSYGAVCALRSLNLEIGKNELFTVMGPTGSGKTTMLRCLNRLNDVVPSGRHSGSLYLDGVDVYDPRVDVTVLRRRVGMVFALPAVLPTSIFENVAYGPRRAGERSKAALSETVERSLTAAALWEEVKDRLGERAETLSGGQQQRLALARVLALGPDVILLDEPTSGLDPISTLRIEDLLRELSRQYTIVLATHNPQQAARVGSRVGFLMLGELVEVAEAGDMFTRPRDPRTEAFVSGRLG
ncbi:MAG: phosphate ABC transporter ATP-binding protein [Firmicutes bacterium]|nr:phosphate ABC transporter ATP-binding protein [Bacillota bacterium]